MHMKFGEQEKTRILAVDVEPTIAVTLAAILKEEGYETETAFSGEEAVVKAKSFSPNLLITDSVIGAMNGMEIATRITTKLPNCRVLFYSGTTSFYELSHSAPKRLVFSLARKPTPVPYLLSAIAYIVSSGNAICDPAAAIEDKEPAQRWRVATLAQGHGNSFARETLSGAPSRKSCLGMPYIVRSRKLNLLQHQAVSARA